MFLSKKVISGCYFKVLSILLLLADWTYSFLQYYATPLDGDMSKGIVLTEGVSTLFKDPFGISVLINNATYPNPNRFFAHQFFYEYFNHVPLWLQYFVSPIDSVYLSIALAKISIHITLLILLAFYLTGKFKIFNIKFLIAVMLLSPLFQTNGYKTYMAIIDPSTTYTFFYALPITLLLLFYLPFYLDAFYKTDLIKKLQIKVLLVFLAIYIPFSGVLNTGIVLIITTLFVINSYFRTDKQKSIKNRLIQAFSSIPTPNIFLFTLISALSIYSIFIGLNNSIFINENTPIITRYSRIPMGLFYILTGKIGFFILLLMIGTNIFLIRYSSSAEDKNTIRFLGWMAIFFLFYILLLPLGGYKSYRPYIIRYDTFMPVTIGLLFIYAKTTGMLLGYLNGKRRNIYIAVVILFSFVFINADKPEFDKNQCERKALKTIASSNKKVVLIPNDCTVMSWRKIIHPEDSKINGQLLKKWNITKDVKQYFQLNSKNIPESFD